MVVSIKKIIILSLFIEFLYVNVFVVSEPSLAIADSTSSSVVFTQVVSGAIAITEPIDVTMTPLTLIQDTSVASTTWTVTTNNSTGYTLKISSTAGAGAMRNDVNHFTDYAGPATPWTVTDSYEFGFSAIGSKTTGYGTDTESNCADALNIPSSTLGWEPFLGVTQIEIASSTTATGGDGQSTTLCVADEQDGTGLAPTGTYYATTTATATTNP